MPCINISLYCLLTWTQFGAATLDLNNASICSNNVCNATLSG